MPTYRFLNKKSGKEWVELMGISECDEYLKANPHVERLVHGCPAIVSGVGTRMKVPGDYSDMLKTIKKRAGKKNSVNVH
jgi:hypothetical protein